MLQGLGEQAQPRQNFALTRERARSIGIAAAIFVAYLLSARLSLFLQTQPDGVAVFWPAAGVSSGILIALGRDVRWPVAAGVIAATIVANLTSDRTVWSSSVFALCNAGEALLAAWFVERYIGSDFGLDRLRHVVGLLAAAVVAPAISGLGGAAGYRLLHSPDVPFLTSWQHWFASDAIGIITVAPLVIGVVSTWRAPPPQGEVVEGLIALIATAAMTAAIIFVLPEIWWDVVLPFELLFPMLLWLAARCRPAFTAFLVFAVCLTIVFAITFSIGHFGKVATSMENRILGAQAGILGIALCALVLAALFAERRLHEAVLMESEDRMRAIVNTVVDGILTTDERGVIESVNPAAADVFGYRPEALIGRNIRMLIPDPYQREYDNYVRSEEKAIGPGREIVGQREDGSTFPMELAISEMAVAGRRMFTGVVRDITKRRRAEDHQKVLVAELDHRVKNILAQVAVVAVSTRQGSRSIGEFLQSLDGRIQSMAAVHTLLSQSGWESVRLDVLARDQLAPYATGTNVAISGANVMLTAAQSQAVGRVLHELVTNAAKYGALSIPEGRVSVTWECMADGDGARLALIWRELGGPPVPPDVKSSYGSNLIRNLVPHELGGAVDLAFAPEGVSCRIEIPLAQVRD